MDVLLENKKQVTVGPLIWRWAALQLLAAFLGFGWYLETSTVQCK